jgi:hypothetical protein
MPYGQNAEFADFFNRKGRKEGAKGAKKMERKP